MITYISIGLAIISLGICIRYPIFKQKRKLLKVVNNSKKTHNFVFFLLYHNLYKEFMNNLKNDCGIKSIDIWLNHTNKTYYITEAFKWDETKQGYEYWYKYNMLWNKQFKKRRTNIKELYILINRNL